MLVQKLKPWVTSFSEAIHSSYNHGDQVCVGGQVLDILDMSNLLPDEDGAGVYLTLDDGVGINNVAVPKRAFDEYKEKYGLEVGSILLAEGRIFVLKLQHRGRDIPKHTEKTTRILSWRLSPLPEEETLEV